MKKLNWGHKIAIVYLSFMGFMITMVVISTQHNHELVTDDYYAKEVMLQGTIDASKNMAGAPFQLELAQKDGKFELQFVDLEPTAKPEGKVMLYKPDNILLDEEHVLALDVTQRMTIVPVGGQGRYKMSVRFSIDGRDYYVEKNLFL
jgi:hypothetical protein